MSTNTITPAQTKKEKKNTIGLRGFLASAIGGLSIAFKIGRAHV